MIATSREARHDLEQDVIIECYKCEGKIRRLYIETGLKNWLFLVARNVNYDNQRIENRYSFNKIKEQPEETTLNLIDKVKPTEQMMAQLTEVERMWVKMWIECDFNYLEMQRRSGKKGVKNRISRQHAKKQITKILQRWKDLDIYLQE